MDEMPAPAAVDTGDQLHKVRHTWPARRYVFTGLLTLLLLVGGIGYWAMATSISGAVIASAELRVESKAKEVAHPEGGIVGDIFVRDGVRVEAGQVLLTLDQTVQKANVSLITNQISELKLQKLRLEAEISNKHRINFPAQLQAEVQQNPDLGTFQQNQIELFKARSDGYRQTVEQLRQRILQLNEQIEGGAARKSSYSQRLRSIQDEVARNKTLFDQGLTTMSRLQQFQREEAGLIGEIGAADAEISRLHVQIQETKLQIISMEEKRRENAHTELKDVQSRLAELQERRVVAQDSLSKIEVISPQGGIVQGLAVHASGAVVRPSEPILLIVPTSDQLVIEARVPTQERDRLYIGQEASIRFPAFNQRTTPQIIAHVKKISADRAIDPDTGMPFYLVELTFTETQRALLRDNELVPGMPAEAYVQTVRRSPMSYLLKPLTDNWHRMLRDD